LGWGLGGRWLLLGLGGGLGGRWLLLGFGGGLGGRWLLLGFGGALSGGRSPALGLGNSPGSCGTYPPEGSSCFESGVKSCRRPLQASLRGSLGLPLPTTDQARQHSFAEAK